MQKYEVNCGELPRILEKVEVIIFDVDGTILKDTHIQYWKHLNFATSHYKNTTWSDDEFWNYLRRPQGYTTRQHIVASMLGQDPLEESDMVKNTMEFFYLSFCSDDQKSELFPHVRVAISELSRKGVSLIAFSDTEEILVRKMLSDHELNPYFEFIVGNAKKPSPMVLDETLKRLRSTARVTDENILVIGDNLCTDGALALRAGCSFIYFTGGDEEKAEKFQSMKKTGDIPKDSIMISSHSEMIEAIDAISEISKGCGIK
jgi:phosphoglycolate phosphatase-like HAD superfamily hydrolase